MIEDRGDRKNIYKLLGRGETMQFGEGLYRITWHKGLMGPVVVEEEKPIINEPLEAVNGGEL